MQPVKKIINSITNLNKIIISLILIIFSFLSYLSIPALYKYESLQKQLSKKILNDFNLNIALSNEINYHIFPSPNFTITDSLMTLGSINDLSKFGELKKVKVFISIKNLFSQKELKIKHIKFDESNFIIDHKNYVKFIKYLKESIKKKITITNSKVFFRKSEENETIAIATILNSKIFYDLNNENKKFESKGEIFNTIYDLKINQNLENLDLVNINLFFKELKLKIKNKLSKKLEENKLNGETEISISRDKIQLKYNLINNKFNFNSEKSRGLNFSGMVNTSPFDFDIQILLDELNINTALSLIPKIETYLNTNFLLNKNFSGNVHLNVGNINGSKYIKKFEIIASFANGRINLNKSKIHLKKLGYVELKNFNIFDKKNKIYIQSGNYLNITNLKEFNRALQIPRNKKKNIENLYFELSKKTLDNNFFIDKIIINHNLNKPELKISELSINPNGIATMINKT